MKKMMVLEMVLRLLTLILGVLPATFLVPFSTTFLLLSGLFSLNLPMLLWGLAALAGTLSLWRVVFGRSEPGRMTAICLVAGMFAISPLIFSSERVLSLPALPFYMAVLNLLWMGIRKLPAKNNPTGENI